MDSLLSQIKEIISYASLNVNNHVNYDLREKSHITMGKKSKYVHPFIHRLDRRRQREIVILKLSIFAGLDTRTRH